MPFTRDRVWGALWRLAPLPDTASPGQIRHLPATAEDVAREIRQSFPRLGAKYVAQPVTHNDLIAVRRVLGDLAIEGIALVIGKESRATGSRPTTYYGSKPPLPPTPEIA